MAQSRSEVMRETVKTAYADLRPTDLVIDKSGQAWPIAELGGEGALVIFWLCDPVTNIKMHAMTKPGSDAVKVSRLPTQADEVAKLEADFPKSTALTSGGGVGTETTISLGEAVAAVEAIGGEVEAEVTAEEVDAANAATDDEPVQLPPFTDMDILQMRSHLYLLHGVFAHDMRSRQETITMHDQAHADHGAGKLHSCYIPHAHTEVK